MPLDTRNLRKLSLGEYGMKSYIYQFLLISATVTALGCAGSKTNLSFKERLLHDGYPPSYVEGYETGYQSTCAPDTERQLLLLYLVEEHCKNDSKRTKIVKDTSKDRSYDQGWNDGQKQAAYEIKAIADRARDINMDLMNHNNYWLNQQNLSFPNTK
jgi:hypothetical protein